MKTEPRPVGGGHRVDVVPAEARSLQGHRAGLVSRAIANVIDFAFVYAAVLAAYLAITFALFVWRGSRFTFPTPSFDRVILLATLFQIAYFATSWATSGRTYGDRLMGLRVLDRNRKTLRIGPALARGVLCALFPVGLLWVGISRGNRSVQDLIMRTSVIYDWAHRAAIGELGPDGVASGDPLSSGVDVQPSVTDEPDDRHPEALPRVDGE